MSVPAAFDAEVQTESAAFLTYFDTSVDPRQANKVLSPRDEVLLPCLLATLDGAEIFVDITLFGVKKHDLLLEIFRYQGDAASKRRRQSFMGASPRCFMT